MRRRLAQLAVVVALGLAVGGAARAADPAPVDPAPVDRAPVDQPPPAPPPAPAPAAEPAPVIPLAATTLAPDDAAFYGSNAGGSEALGATTYPKLEISGFTDFAFIANLSDKNDTESTMAWQFPSFAIGNLNLYLNSALADAWHLLAEVRFLYLPSGATNFPTNGGQAVAPMDTSVLDYADDDRLLSWGGIQIQRVQIDYTPHPLLSFRFGQFLTPVGIWNIDHGSPTVIGVYRPYIIGEGLFPLRQTGLQVSGEWAGAYNQAGYFATLSNGRGPSDAYSDLDDNKAIGGRLYWTNTAYGTLTVGASAYKGTFSSRDREYGLKLSPGQPPALIGTNPLTLQYREQSIAGDVRWEWKGLLLQAEAMQHEVVYTNGYRLGQNGLIFADYRERGYYVLGGFRTPWFGIMPFATIEGFNFASQPFVPPATSQSVGLNIRAKPTVVFKLQFQHSSFDPDSKQPLRGVLKRFLTQLAVAF